MKTVWCNMYVYIVFVTEVMAPFVQFAILPKIKPKVTNYFAEI